MEKWSHFLAETEAGPTVFPLHTRQYDAVFEKVAAPRILPGVARYIERLQPRRGCVYILISAMGAAEFYGANANADAFHEIGLHGPALSHAPPDWDDEDQEKCKRLAAKWPYGFPTFYRGHPFHHHKNTDPRRAFGIVDMAAWNPHMRRVELVARVEEEKCKQFGGQAVWDKLQNNGRPDTSMGARVPFDFCLSCGDVAAYMRALKLYNPAKHKHEGMAVLEEHKRLIKERGKGIRGVAVTRKEYCKCMLEQANHILANGVRVAVANDFPDLFDISFVLVGADKTSKAMEKVGSRSSIYVPGVVEQPIFLGLSADMYEGEEEQKVASAVDTMLAKAGEQKRAVIIKKVPPHPDAVLVRKITRKEASLPRAVLDKIAQVPLETSLATLGSHGVVLRPQEFQYVALSRMGKFAEARKCDDEGAVFPRSDKAAPMSLGSSNISALLSSLLAPFLSNRGCAPDRLRGQITVVVLQGGGSAKDPDVKKASLGGDILATLGAAYNGYRHGLLDPNTVSLLPGSKQAASEEATALTQAYLHHAFWDEFPEET
jgi:hypothetical protein